MLHDIFISYSAEDQSVADRIVDLLEGNGIRAWIANRHVVGGTYFSKAIIDAIDTSKVIVLILSKNSNASEYVLGEIHAGFERKLKIIPFVIGNITPRKELQFYLGTVHRIDAGSNPTDENLQRLAESIKLLLSERNDGEPTFKREAGWCTRRRALLFTAIVVFAVLAFGISRLVILPRPAQFNRIAFLPFKNRTIAATPARDSTIDTLTEELPRLLSNDVVIMLQRWDAQKNHVTRAAVIPFDLHKDDVHPEKSLAPATLVNGELWTANGRTNFRLALWDVDSDGGNRITWTRSLESESSKNLSVEHQLLPLIAYALKVQLDPKEIDSLPGTKDVEARQDYAQALVLEQPVTEANNKEGIRLLRDAITRDPGYAQAYARLAAATATRYWWGFSKDKKELDIAEEWAHKALGLNPTLAEAHDALGSVLASKGNRVEALKAFTASLRADRHYIPALLHVADWSFYMGDFARSDTALDAVARIDPTINIHVRRAMSRYFAGRAEQSLGENEEAEHHAQGSTQLTLVAFTYVWLDRPAKAEHVLEQLRQDYPSNEDASGYLLEIGGWLDALRGDSRGADAKIERLFSLNKNFGIKDEVAVWYAQLGDREKAVEMLVEAVNEGAPLLTWYRSEFFKIARGDPRYEAVLKKLSDEYQPLRRELDEAVAAASR